MNLPRRPTQPGAFFDWLRRMWDEMAPLRILESPTVKPHRTPRGTYLHAVVPLIAGGGAVEVQEFIIKPPAGSSAVAHDYVWAKTHQVHDGEDPTIGETFHIIAKHWALRRTPFHGQTINGVTYNFPGGVGQRTATRAGVVYTEEIVPNYEEDQVIHAVRLDGNTIDADGISTDWVEISPGRLWLPQEAEFVVCTPAGEKTYNVRASDPR